MASHANDMLMVLVTWRVVVRGDRVSLALLNLGKPSWVKPSEADDRPTYDQLVRRATEFAMGRPSLVRIRRHAFVTGEQYDALRRELADRGTVTDLILQRLGELGWTQSDLARATGIAKQNLGPMLKGLRPIRAQHMMVIDHVLNLELDYSAARFRASDSAPVPE